MSEAKTVKKTGLVLGKFLPPHLGHAYLIDFARNYVDELIVVIGIGPTDTIPSMLRIKWLIEMFPDVKIIIVNDRNPEESHPHYWDIWEKTLRSSLPYIPEYLFASEDYGFKLAEILGMIYVPVDHNRELVPISATLIRENPYKYWKYIPEVVRPFFLKKICVFGPESTGKTTLTRKLAKYYKTPYVTEYARPLLDFKNGNVDYKDIPRIARGQIASEKALEKYANRVLFADTDVLTTTIWSNILFGKCPQWIYNEAEKQKYDLYLVLDVDVPWISDNQRYLPKKRKWFLNLCIEELKKRNRKYVLISGNWDKRFKKAVKEVEKIIK